MHDRSWLKALKEAMGKRSMGTDETSEKMPGVLFCEGCESPVNDSPSNVNTTTAEEVRGSWGEEERRLIVAGWKPKERCGITIWQRPDNSFYCSQEAATHFLDRGLGNNKCKSGANGKE